MAKTVPVEVRIAGAPQFRQFAGSAAALLEVLGRYGDLPQPVEEAAARLQYDLAALTPGDDAVSDEDRIRGMMAEAKANPGKVITR